MPYSFVLDWFVDIGGYMEALEQALGADSISFKVMKLSHIAYRLTYHSMGARALIRPISLGLLKVPCTHHVLILSKTVNLSVPFLFLLFHRLRYHSGRNDFCLQFPC